MSNWQDVFVEKFWLEKVNVSYLFYLQAWVYQDDVNRTNDKSATCDSETIEVIDDNTYIGSSKRNNSNKHKSSAKSKRKHMKNSRGYSFLHRIWKSFRRKILILETV